MFGDFCFPCYLSQSPCNWHCWTADTLGALTIAEVGERAGAQATASGNTEPMMTIVDWGSIFDTTYHLDSRLGGWIGVIFSGRLFIYDIAFFHILSLKFDVIVWYFFDWLSKAFSIQLSWRVNARAGSFCGKKGRKRGKQRTRAFNL